MPLPSDWRGIFIDENLIFELSPQDLIARLQSQSAEPIELTAKIIFDLLNNVNRLYPEYIQAAKNTWPEQDWDGLKVLCFHYRIRIKNGDLLLIAEKDIKETIEAYFKEENGENSKK
ncbi:MAG: hypothetical protein U5L10_05095 [Candidatus Moranbacteria bacterium]|nr:hypothetical protein [Candidatus Moranbacteria bacterium]